MFAPTYMLGLFSNLPRVEVNTLLGLFLKHFQWINANGAKPKQSKH